jgi:hypothetical protein
MGKVLCVQSDPVVLILLVLNPRNTVSRTYYDVLLIYNTQLCLAVRNQPVVEKCLLWMKSLSKSFNVPLADL